MADRAVPYVLMYHSVADEATDPHDVTVSPARFARQIRWLYRHRLRGVAMGELLRAVDAGRAHRLVGLTFDDGYADFVHLVAKRVRHRLTWGSR